MNQLTATLGASESARQPGPGQPAARYGADGVLFGPRWVIWGVASGLFLLAGAVILVVWTLDMRVTADALAHHGMYVERRLEEYVKQVGAEEFSVGGGGLTRFSARLVFAATNSPVVRELVVVGPDGKVVRQFGSGRETRPCRNALTPGTRTLNEHPSGQHGPDPVGCLQFPVRVGGRVAASVYLHVTRDWAEGGTLVRSAVRRTALQIAPVFALFYLLLGVLLVAATRAGQRWRRKALQAERVEALGAMASGINHEIKNPLNALGLCLQVLERRHRDAETAETLTMAHAQAKQIVGSLDEFARFTRVAQLRLKRAGVGDLLRERAARSRWPVEVSGNARARVDAAKIEEAIEAIVELLDSQRASGPDGVERPHFRIQVAETRSEWMVEAVVSAPDLDPAILPHLFDPFLRTRPTDIGRGLAWAKAVFQAHGGDLSARYRDGRIEVTARAEKEPGD